MGTPTQSWLAWQQTPQGHTQFQQIQQELHLTSVIQQRRITHRWLVKSLNSTTHLVRVLKVQKMWNWRIPADFHIKPQVRFLRYRFQCTDQSAMPRKSTPVH
ncbi:uncharacterized protein si:ch211-80h18.1 [Pungitius pungitius]|uniref:uncharacterized protein si:ch211-80h18.1 n=1 Tax=Pungitius pungitius TaxID=134920 RepID=UPI002E160F87